MELARKDKKYHTSTALYLRVKIHCLKCKQDSQVLIDNGNES